MTNDTFFRGSVLALALTLAASVEAAAQSGPAYETGAFVGISHFTSSPPSRISVFRDGAPHLVVRNAELEQAVTAGVHAGVRLTDRYGIGMTLAWTPTRMAATHGLVEQGGAVDVNTLGYGLTFSHHWPSFRRVQPFAGVGIGAETSFYEPDGWKSRTDFVASFSAGADVALKEGLSLRLGAHNAVTAFESMVAGEDDRLRSQLVLSMGVSLLR
jgi:outer membrane protein W